MQKILERDNKGRILKCAPSSFKPEICPGCNGTFVKKLNRQKYCTKECFYKICNSDKLGKTRPQSVVNKLRLAKIGSKNPAWRGGVSSDRVKLLNTQAYKNWRKSIYERDNYTCVKCGERGGKLNADHIIPWFKDESKRLDTSNGQTLCKACHIEKTKLDMKGSYTNQYTKGK